MITKVKKNKQRIGFTKPSHIECAVQFRNPFQNKTNFSRNISLEMIESTKYGGGIYSPRRLY